VTGDSGAHPMPPRRPGDDGVDMTVLAVTHDIRRGRFGRIAAARLDGRDDRRGRDDMPMDLAREMKMQDLRMRIERDAYAIDADAVAEAIVARLLAGGSAGPQCS
jgi:hypothetical protein